MPKAVGRSGAVRVKRLVTLLRQGDKSAAAAFIRDIFEATGSRVALFADVIHPAQYEIGDLWYRGEIGIADEHRATAIVEEVTSALPPTPAQGRSPRGRCVLAAVDAEQHVVGLRLLAAALEDDGWTVTMLGGRTPTPDLAAVVRKERPKFVGLSAAYLPRPDSLRMTIDEIKKLRVPVLVGGPAFNRNESLWTRVGADGHGTDVRVAVALAQRIAAS
ncbi:MAG: cobalamin B12-binding domain-containing protein [Candidatus Dormibacteraeota bacterium]|nr:cobalamin B12-binding domain-containing protein [Candidatus Dormibacteraeota bacterium]